LFLKKSIKTTAKSNGPPHPLPTVERKAMPPARPDESDRGERLKTACFHESAKLITFFEINQHFPGLFPWFRVFSYSDSCSFPPFVLGHLPRKRIRTESRCTQHVLSNF